MKKKITLEELEKRVAELEKNPQTRIVYVPQPYQIFTPQQTAPVHYHNGMPCYQNPCSWC